MKNKIAIIRNGKIIYDEEAIIIKPSDTNARSEREAGRKNYAKDIIQPNSVEYAKAYPDDFRKRYGDEAYRLAS